MARPCIVLLCLAVPLYAVGDWRETLTPPAYHGRLKVAVEEIRARDSVLLRALVYRPNTRDRYPALLINTPYDKMRADYLAFAQYFAERGYAAVIVDVRGRYDSEGENYLYGPHDGPDLYDIQSW